MRRHHHKPKQHPCMEDGCKSTEGIACFYEVGDQPDVYYCWEHIVQNGFCRGCGQFWAGVDSFDFQHYGWCDNCWDQVSEPESEFEYEDDYYESPYEEYE